MYLLIQTQYSGSSDNVETERHFYGTKEQAMRAMDYFIKTLPVETPLGPGDFAGDDHSFTVRLGDDKAITWVGVEVSKPKYKLVFVEDRVIYDESRCFETHEEAFDAMLTDMKRIASTYDYIDESDWEALVPKITKELSDSGHYEQDDLIVEQNCAYIDGPYSNWDWYILTT